VRKENTGSYYLLLTAASRGFPAIDGFLVFPRVVVRVRVRVRIRARVRETLSYGVLSYSGP